MAKVRGYQIRSNGWMAYVKVGKEQRTKMFPIGTAQEVIDLWRAEQRLSLKQAKPASGTLAADVEKYLRLRSSMPSINDRRRDLESWVLRFGARIRTSITPAEITDQLNRWLAEVEGGRLRFAPNTIKHRRDALSNLYRVLDGKGSPNPVRDAIRIEDSEAVDRAISMADVRRILAQMEKNALEWGPKARTVSLSWVRATLLAYTGMRAGELMALVETDVRLTGDESCVIVRTSKGGKPRRVPLNTDAVEAFRTLRALNAWGPFSVSSLRKSLHAACGRLELPPIHPHVLRHSFASWLVNEGGVSLKTAKAILGHRNVQTTVRYVRDDEAAARRALLRLTANQTG
jgi:integrase